MVCASLQTAYDLQAGLGHCYQSSTGGGELGGGGEFKLFMLALLNSRLKNIVSLLKGFILS